MTTTAYARRLVLAACALGIMAAAVIVVLLAAARPAERPAAVVEPAAGPSVAAPAPQAQLDPLVLAVAPATEVAPEQAEVITLTADRVCEGLTAGVPMVDLTAGLSQQLGLDDTEARAFVVAVIEVRGCQWVDPVA